MLADARRRREGFARRQMPQNQAVDVQVHVTWLSP